MAYDKTQLIEDCIKGHRKAHEAFYDLYKSRIFGICLRYAKDQDDAKDILQEAYIKMFRQLKTLKNPDALDSWVRQSVIRTAINHYHRYIKNRPTEGSYEVEVQNEDYTKIISGLTNEELMKYINALPDGYRIVFNLYVIDGYSHKEIAGYLEVSESTSKSQLRAAKLKLKEMLDKIGIKRYEQII